MNVGLVVEERIGQRLLRAFDDLARHRPLFVFSANRVVARLCRQRGLTCFEPDDRFAERVVDACRVAGARLLLNVHALHRLPAEALRRTGVAALNLHPSPLPALAGLFPFVWAIHEGHARHGVTLHRVAPRFDAGPVVARRSWDVPADATAASLFARCEDAGLELLVGLLEHSDAAVEAALDAAEPQPSAGRTYRGLRHIRKPPVLSPDMSRAIASRIARSRDFRPHAAPWPLPRWRMRDRWMEVLGLAGEHEPSTTAEFADGRLELSVRPAGARAAGRTEAGHGFGELTV